MSRQIKVDTNSVIVDNDASTSGEHFIKLLVALLAAQDVAYEYASDSRLYNIAYDVDTGTLTWEDRNDPGTKSVTVQNASLVGMLRESFGKAAQQYPTLEQIQSVVHDEIVANVPTVQDIHTEITTNVPSASEVAAAIEPSIPSTSEIAIAIEAVVPTKADVRAVGQKLLDHDIKVQKHFLSEG